MGSVDDMLSTPEAVKKAAANLGKLPPALRPSMRARILTAAKKLGITVELSNDLRNRLDV